MIKETDVFRQALHFHSPFEIAYERVESAEVVIVRIVTGAGLVGLGNAAPDTEVTGETVEAVLKILQQKLNAEFFSEPFDSWYRYHLKIQQTFAGFPSAQAAVEEAVLNLWSQVTKVPLSVFFGGYRRECPVMITIGIKDEKSMEEEILKRLSEGFKTIKLKCGLDADGDIVRIRKARAVIPEDCHLILDANQGYSFSDAEKLLDAIRDLNIDLIEQPIDAGDLEGLKRLHRKSPVPVIADEAVVSVDDAYHLLENDFAAGVNVKLMKCGGPVNFLQIFNLAKRLNKIIMIGCMYESHISMTTGGLLALGLPIDYVDLDSGHLDFYDDPVKGGAEIINGSLSVPGPVLL